MFSLQTERLLLRDFKADDFEHFFGLTQDSEYRRFYPESELTRPFTQTIFQRILSWSESPERTHYQLAVCLPSENFIGTCGVRLEDKDNQQASFGCGIDRPFWGRGYATEAARALFAFGFSSLNIHRIFAETNAENRRARALAEHLGMRLEGIMRQTKYFRGRWWDTAVYAILVDEWQKS